MNKALGVLAGTCLVFTITSAFGAIFQERDFEKLVLQENAELKALHDRREALAQSVEEARLIFGWQLIGEVSHLHDQRPSLDPSFSYSSLTNLSVQVGVQKQFSWGLESKLQIETIQTEISEGSNGAATFDSKDWRTQPSLDLRLPLLAGGFGRKIRAEYQSLIAKKRIEALTAEIEYDQKFNEAQRLLWSTVLQKESLRDQQETLERIKKIYDIVQSKARQNLEASSNFLLTRSALEQAELDLKNSTFKFSQMERLLKLVLNRAPGTVISAYDFAKFTRVSLAEYQDRVTAQEKLQIVSEDLQRHLALAQAEESRAKLDLIGSLKFAGDDTEWARSLSESARAKYPTTFIGVQWIVPLDFGLTARARERRADIERAAQQKQQYFRGEQKSVLKEDLVTQYNELVDMLVLNIRLEKTQSEKLKNERALLSQGRSSIYQVLQFELDLARAKTGKFALAAELETLKQKLALNKYNTYE